MTDPANLTDEDIERLANGDQGVTVEQLIAERDNYLDQLQRSMADFANYRRRVDAERAQARAVGTRDLLRQVIPMLDDLQRAVGSVPEDQLETSWVQGVQLIERKMRSMLEREGVTVVPSLGEPFDPSLHEAVVIDPGSTQNRVVEVFQDAYRQGDFLLRPAMVRVGDLPQA